jgi:hypothetical protein
MGAKFKNAAKTLLKYGAIAVVVCAIAGPAVPILANALWIAAAKTTTALAIAGAYHVKAAAATAVALNWDPFNLG